MTYIVQSPNRLNLDFRAMHTSPLTLTLNATELDGLLERLPKEIRVLSLDCFDTLFWRKVFQPSDVFFSLQKSLLWQSHGITAAMRVEAENQARKQRLLREQRQEVSLVDIYRTVLPGASTELIAQAEADELACELEHGFGFEPVVRLVEQAYAQGLKVIVVSDTYFHSEQLKRLLSHAMGASSTLFDQIYCSSEIGYGKSNGMWPVVLKREKLQPHAVFHLGDNRIADQLAPSGLGICTGWLRNHTDDLQVQLNQRASAALQVMPELRHTHAVPSHFHAILAIHDPESESTPQKIGYRSFGPILYAFDQFISSEIQAMRDAEKPVKLAFLLRDGYMPALAYACHAVVDPGSQISVSRFAAIAASFRSRADVVELLVGDLSAKSLPVLARQLLLPKQKTEQLLTHARMSRQPELEFARLVLRNDTLKLIFQRSLAFRKRLLAHVQEKTGVQAGDTLVLVDLGYAGTVQNKLRGIFKDDLGVDLFGLYLIARHTQTGPIDRRGLIDGRQTDSRLVHSLTAFIGLLEMMCSKAEPTTEDYTPDGQPVYATQQRDLIQVKTVDGIQLAGLQFVKDMLATPQRFRPQRTHPQELAQHCMADLARLMYFPSQEEVACFSSFEFDVNLGSDLLLATAQLDAGAAEYRREGFAMMNQELSSQRIGYPLEMRYMDISLATTFFSQQRFGYGLRPSEASFRRETVPTLVANRTQHTLGSEQAYATSEGFFRLHLPMSYSFDLSILFGQRYEWLQLDSIQKVPLEQSRQTEDIGLGEAVFLDGLEQVEGTLVKFNSNGMMYFPACSLQDHGQYMIRVVFRPILERCQVAQPGAHDAA